MTLEEWETIEHFNVKEKWGDPYKMHYRLLIKLDMLRRLVRKPIIILVGYTNTGHAPNSYHYKGKAVDCYIMGMSLLDQYIAAERIDFGGIGVYPFWHNPGLHLDIRPEPKYAPLSRWWRTKDGRYLPLDSKAFIGGGSTCRL